MLIMKPSAPILPLKISSASRDSAAVIGANDDRRLWHRCSWHALCASTHYHTEICLLLVVALVLTVTTTQRAVSFHMAHKPWVHAPIHTIERSCPKPTYKTVADDDQASSSLEQSRHHPKICLTTLTDESEKSMATKFFGWRNYDGLLGLTWENKQSYADRHGYTLWNESSELDKSRPPSWSKILAVKRLLTQEDCDWVFWMDADTVIMNPERRLEDFLPSAAATSHYDLLLSGNVDIGAYNAGVWILRRSEWSLRFLETWWSMKSFVKPPGLSQSGDNAAFKELLRAMPDFHDRCLVPPHCTFNSFAKFIAPSEIEHIEETLHQQDWYMSEAYYHKGDFIAHLAGVDNKKETLEMMLELLEP